MAPKSTKRGAAQAMPMAPPPKVARKGAKAVQDLPRKDPLLEPILEIIRMADGLPESCKQMLIVALPHSFSTPSNGRGVLETRIVEMVGKIVEDTKAKMQRDVDSEIVALQRVEAKCAELQARFTEAEERLTAAVVLSQTKSEALVGFAETLDNKKKGLSDAREVQNIGNAQHVADGQERDIYTSIVSEHFKPLLEEELESAEAEKHYKFMVEYIKKLQVDASLLTSLPNACSKPPSSRGPFDHMVFQEVDKKLTERIQTLTERLTAGAVAVAERAAAEEAAQSELVVAEEAHCAASEELAQATSVQKECSDAVCAAKAEQANVALELATATKARDAKVSVLNQFNELNVSRFVELRDKASSKNDVEMGKGAPDVPLATAGEVGGA